MRHSADRAHGNCDLSCFKNIICHLASSSLLSLLFSDCHSRHRLSARRQKAGEIFGLVTNWVEIARAPSTLHSQQGGHAWCDPLLAQIRPLCLREGNIHLLIHSFAVLIPFIFLAVATSGRCTNNIWWTLVTEARWRSEDRKLAGMLKDVNQNNALQYYVIQTALISIDLK